MVSRLEKASRFIFYSWRDRKLLARLDELEEHGRVDPDTASILRVRIDDAAIQHQIGVVIGAGSFALEIREDVAQKLTALERV